MREKPLVSVIVLNWNGKQFLKDCLSSLLNQTYPSYEVIIVDNGSTDGSVEYIKQSFMQVRVIENQRNIGFADGNNVGMRHAKGKYVIVLNNDTEVQENFIEELVKVAEGDQEIGSVGCKIVQYDGTIRYGPVFMNRNGFIVGARSHETFDKFLANLANCGCASLYRKSTLDKIGMYDSNFWSDWEDHDLGYRVNLSGFKSVYTPKTIVFHVGSGSFKGVTKERFTRITRNTLLTYFKNYEPKNIILRFTRFACMLLARHIIVVISLNELRILKRKFIKAKPKSTPTSILIERRKLYTTLFKAYFSFLRNFKSIFAERKKVQKLRKTSDDYIFSISKEA